MMMSRYPGILGLILLRGICIMGNVKINYADMAELADAPDLGSGVNRRAGSTPVIRTF